MQAGALPDAVTPYIGWYTSPYGRAFGQTPTLRLSGHYMLLQTGHGAKGRLVTSLYEHAGGEEALHRLEELFYAKVLADPVLGRLFPTRQPHHVEHLTWFTAESFGGPDRFTRELGFDHLIKVHRHLMITEEERQRFGALYMEALDEAGLPDDVSFRKAVRSHIEFGSRVAQQNSHAKTDADLHPLREVPRWTWSEESNE